MRLIDVNELLALVKKNAPFIYSILAPITLLCPTIEAVPVVRCKDCKHYGWEQESCHGRTQHFCKLHNGLVVVGKDTFCSYGERRCDNK